MNKNKVEFGLSNLYYAPIIDDTTVPPEYGTPIELPGAVGLSPDADTNETVFYADNIRYFVTSQTNGYSADLEVAKFTDEMLVDILGWAIDKNGALVETMAGIKTPFALMGQVEGDISARRFIFYKCIGSTPQREESTSENSNEPVTETMKLTISPVNLGVDFSNTGNTMVIKAQLPYSEASAAKYSDFFKNVYIPEKKNKRRRRVKYDKTDE